MIYAKLVGGPKDGETVALRNPNQDVLFVNQSISNPCAANPEDTAVLESDFTTLRYTKRDTTNVYESGTVIFVLEGISKAEAFRMIVQAYKGFDK